MTGEIAKKLVALETWVLVGIVSRWGSLTIENNIATTSSRGFRFLARLRETLGVVSTHSLLGLRRFGKDCGVTVNSYSDVQRVTLIRETQKNYGPPAIYRIVDKGKDPFVRTVDEFYNCIHLILADYQRQPEQSLATPSGSVWGH